MTIGRTAALLVGLLAAGCGRKSPPPPVEPAPSAAAAPAASVELVEAPEVANRGSGTTVHVKWQTPAGTGINEDAPFRVRWKKSEGLTEAPPEMKATGANVKDGFDVHVAPLPGAPRATLDGDVDVVVCDVATHRVCVPVRRSLDLGFVVTADAPGAATLDIRLPAAKAR